jgi:hypothetical protein
VKLTADIVTSRQKVMILPNLKVEPLTHKLKPLNRFVKWNHAEWHRCIVASETIQECDGDVDHGIVCNKVDSPAACSPG